MRSHISLALGSVYAALGHTIGSDRQRVLLCVVQMVSYINILDDQILNLAILLLLVSFLHMMVDQALVQFMLVLVLNKIENTL